MLDNKKKRFYNTKNCCGFYKKRLSRINKRRLRLDINNYIIKTLEEETNNDLLMSEFFTDAEYHEYHMFEHEEWLRYLGRNWTLEDELEYCDKVYEDFNIEDINEFTEEEINYHISSFNKAQEVQTDLIERAKNALQTCRDYQNAWQKYGIIGRFKLYFGIR